MIFTLTLAYLLVAAGFLNVGWENREEFTTVIQRIGVVLLLLAWLPVILFLAGYGVAYRLFPK